MLSWAARNVFFPLWQWKDGAHRGRYLRELSASQWLSADALRARQWERLRETVSYAFARCPHYRTSFARAGFDGVLRDRDQFRRLPLLGKREVRSNPGGLCSSEYAARELVEARTGGSTGTSLVVYFDSRCQELRNAAAMRCNQWAGWDIGTKVAALWGNAPIPGSARERLRNLLLDRLIYLDTMNIDDATVLDFVRRWRRERPQVLFGHSHSLYIVACMLQRMGIRDIRPRGIVSTSMILLAPERERIESVFGCRVTDRYGCEETGLIACECEAHAGLHLNVDHLFVEFLRDDGSDAAPGEEGQIVVTDLVNRGMPLIRYQVGDLGVPSDRRCPCGRGLPLMERVIGRRADFLKRLDGSLVAGVSLVERTLTAIPGIEQMQIVQDEPGRVCARVVEDGLFDASAAQRLHDELRLALGEGVAIEIHRVAALGQTEAGKFRFAICNV